MADFDVNPADVMPDDRQHEQLHAADEKNRDGGRRPALGRGVV